MAGVAHLMALVGLLVLLVGAAVVKLEMAGLGDPGWATEEERGGREGAKTAARARVAERDGGRGDEGEAVLPPPPPTPPPPTPVPSPPLPPRPHAPFAGARALTKEYVDAHAPAGKDIVVTWCNAAYLDFAENFVTLLRAAKHEEVFVASMDDEAAAALEAKGIATFAMPGTEALGASDLGWGSPRFHSMGRAKAALLKAALETGRNVWLCDVDVAFMQSPVAWLRNQPDEVVRADVLASSDHLRSTTERGDDGLEWPFEAMAAMNIGIMRFRPTDAARSFLEDWMKAIERDSNYWDQNAFNDLARKGADLRHRPKVKGATRLFQGHHGKLAVGILPVSAFLNGHTYFVSRLHNMHGVKPVAAHATFQFCGTEGKRHRFREAKLWRVDSRSYYDRPGGFLSMHLATDRAAADAAARAYNGHIETVKPHFDVVHAQLRQIRDALAIAVALGRALIVPELLCPLDRVWFAHTGVFPGSALQLPFACPLDHVLEVDVLQRTSLPADTFGPPIDFRESTFLDAAAMKPHWVTRTDVVVCDPSSDSQCDPDDASVGSSVRAPSNLTAAGWRALQAARFANAKVVHLPSVPPACFGGFDDPAIERGFTERLKMSGGPWGQTVRTSGPGHIWYDLFWDRAPFTDRFGRSRAGPWAPVAGDA